MSDGTLQTGSDIIWTEDYGASGKIQRVKLALGTVDTDNGNVSSGNPMPTSSYAVHATANFTRSANTTAYAASQVVTAAGGGAIAVSGCARINSGSGIITQIILADSNNAATPLNPTVYLFDAGSAPSSIADNGALALSTTDLDNLCCVVSLSETYLTNSGSTSSGNRIWIARGLSAGFSIVGASTSLYAYVVSNAAYTPLSGEVFRLNITVLQN